MALSRLLDRQGILKGDLNIVQQLALQRLIAFELNDMAETEAYKIKTQLMIAHPELAKDIMKEGDDDEFDYEELEELDLDDPSASHSPETIDQMLGSLRNLGFFVGDIDARRS